jgi:RHS repeat-associated protein
MAHNPLSGPRPLIPEPRPPTLGFTGELQDSSGMVYLRARWYNPQKGRFGAIRSGVIPIGARAQLNAARLQALYL